MTHLHHLNNLIFNWFIRPRSADTDSSRQEYLLNILLTSLAAVTTLALIISGVHFLQADRQHHSTSLSGTIIFSIIIYVLLWLSRSGRFKLSTYLFVGLLALSGLQLLWTYSFELPQALLLFALTIVVSSILLNARVGLLFTAGVAITELGVGYLQLTNRDQPDLSWVGADFNYGDAISYGLVLSIIGIVAWLSNREIDRSLRRARSSESALLAERDNLELKVMERTRELEQAQLLRSLELQRFAEFGRQSASLLHDMSSPLMAATINLQQFGSHKSRLLRQVSDNIQQIERYVVSARSQLQQQTVHKRISVSDELRHITKLLKPLALRHHIRLSTKLTGSYYLYGDIVKFNQLVDNLLLNAIDALQEQSGAKHIRIVVEANKRWVILTINDNGAGIPLDHRDKIFSPFYTTKAEDGRGLGIGLSTVKTTVEQDFGGTIRLGKSADGQGASFVAKLKRAA